MKYENAADILPEDLLKKVKKFAAGKLLYIPKSVERLTWGDETEYKKYLDERNADIQRKFADGKTIDELCEEYNLSVDSIKKIVYSKVVKELKYRCSTSSAKEFADDDRLEEWVHTYLLSDGDNKAFSDGLKLFDRFYIGPLNMPLSLFRRCSGPEENMKYHENKEWFEKRVAALKDTFGTTKDMPPLIVHYVDHDFELCDGNHRFEALKQLNIKEYPVIFWITEQDEYDEFVEKFLM